MGAKGSRSNAASLQDVSVALRARRREIEAGILTRIQSDDAPVEAADPEYAEGLRAAVPSALDYCLAGIESSEQVPPPLPEGLLYQARVAARNGVSLDTVLCRYFAGYTLLGDFLIEEVEAAGLRQGTDLKRLSRALAISFEQLLAAVSEEHSRELSHRRSSSEQRKAEHIERLLSGELLHTAPFSYDFEMHHIGLIAFGPGAIDGVSELSAKLDRRLLVLDRGDNTTWAWLGGRKPLDPDDLIDAARFSPPAALAMGEPAVGLTGWRTTHQQAKAALSIARRSGQPVTRYADVALLATVLQDDLLATSLRQLYLAPLEEERDGGKVACETLCAYLDANQNVSSTAAALGVSRHTVASRVRRIEERLGRRLSDCAAELDAALRLKNMGYLLHTPTASRAA